MSSIFIEQALSESGLPDSGTTKIDDVFGRITFNASCWTKVITISYFGIKQKVPIFIHTFDGSINSIQRECYEEFMSDIEGTLENHKDIFKRGITIDSLIFQIDSLVVILTGKTEDEYYALEFEP